MTKYGIGTNAIIKSSAKLRKWDKRVLECYELGSERAVFKWSSETGIHWLSQLCNEEEAQLRAETYDYLLSNTSRPQKVEGGRGDPLLVLVRGSLPRHKDTLT